MHSNILSTVYLLSVPAGLTLIVGAFRWALNGRLPKKTFILALIFCLLPGLFLGSHIYSEKKQMRRLQGVYKVISTDSLQEICNPSNIKGLELTLHKSGKYSFNRKPCFADRQEGQWKWQDDMMGAYCVFDLKISNGAYLHFDISDTLTLRKEGKDHVTFGKQNLQK
jgi:hypothetical protein